jgi:gas vesicle protein
MVLLGLLLLLVSGVFTAGMVLSNTDAVSASAFGSSLTNLSIGQLFLAGALTGLVFGLGLAMMLAGAARKRARRRGLKSQVKAVRSERESLAEENARLQSELEASRGGTEVYPAEGGKHAETKTGMFRR